MIVRLRLLKSAWLGAVLACGFCATAVAQNAVPPQGSQILLVTESALSAGGKTIRMAPAGAQFKVVATNAAQGVVFISVVGNDGKSTMASIPIANVVVVDGGQPAATASPAPAPVAPVSQPVGQPPAPAPSQAAPAPAQPAASAPKPGPDGCYDAVAVAQFFKADRAGANAQFSGRPLKVKGSVERAEVRVGSEAPIVILGTAQGLPKIKLQVHPAISRDREFYRMGVNWYYDGWYGYGHRLEFRPANNGLEARFKYKRTYSSSGYSGTYKAWSDWFAIFTPGDIIVGEGTCRGLMMDVIVEAADISRPRS